MDTARATRVRVPVSSMKFVAELHAAIAVATLRFLPTQMRVVGCYVSTSVRGGHAPCNVVNCTT
eukprot:9481184-Pyramimonas_sp.AAC.1